MQKKENTFISFFFSQSKKGKISVSLVRECGRPLPLSRLSVEVSFTDMYDLNLKEVNGYLKVVDKHGKSILKLNLDVCAHCKDLTNKEFTSAEDFDKAVNKAIFDYLNSNELYCDDWADLDFYYIISKVTFTDDTIKQY